ncbi:hypothetical protein [Vreelandella salicampi]|uniref:CheW-like domain-containing protein n=1 Tax=Vreelandella salicampi TaxID=1449798 RepID=A0A7Z0LMR9_9GAMM|nr:hypothetical protein [Halomonas salicampi]NYS61803.1 hypothetical protein [Halomonas salicampi]
MATVALVAFEVGSTPYALDARFVHTMAHTPNVSRQIRANALLMAPAVGRLPSHWLTLKDAHGAWQLGVAGNVHLTTLAATQLHPLPPLLKARTHPALCGIGWREDQTPCLLLDGAKLAYPEALTWLSSSDLTAEP